MELKDQVCSLESAKRLKELGVKQESLFQWVDLSGSEVVFLPYPAECDVWIASAFTVAELGEMLLDADYTERGKYNWHGFVDPKTYVNPDGDIEGSCKMEAIEDTEAETRAKMLIYRYENGLLTKGTK